MKYEKTSFFCRLILLIPVFSFAAVYAYHDRFFPELVISFLAILPIGVVLYLVSTLAMCRKRLRFLDIAFAASLNLILCALIAFKVASFYSVPEVPLKPGSAKAQITLMSFNINAGNRDYAAVSKTVSERSPDILAFYEFTDEQATGLKDVLKDYEHESYSYEGSQVPYAVVFSKHPISDLKVEFGYVSCVVSPTEGKELKLYLAHPTVPLTPAYFALRNKILDKLANDIRSDKHEYALVTGDFNLTPWSYHYENFDLAIPMTNISASKPRFTWHAYNSTLVPLHIDHTFLSYPLLQNGYKYELLDESGSDHKPQFIKVSL